MRIGRHQPVGLVPKVGHLRLSLVPKAWEMTELWRLCLWELEEVAEPKLLLVSPVQHTKKKKIRQSQITIERIQRWN